jgi:hypothetical protein
MRSVREQPIVGMMFTGRLKLRSELGTPIM